MWSLASFRKLQIGKLDPEALLAALKAFMAGDYSVRLPTNLPGVDGEIAKTVNEFISARTAVTGQFIETFEKVGETGLLDSHFDTSNLEGRLVEVGDSLNSMLGKLLAPLNEMMEISTAVAHGDLSQRVPIVVDGRRKQGSLLVWAEKMNEMMDVLSTLASEVSRVSHEIGVEGKLGIEATVPGIFGIWKDLVDNVNLMANTRTALLRDFEKVSTAIAQGDLTQKLMMDSQGEVLQIKNTINAMVDQLSTICSEVSRVAREVGAEGKLGGQANVPAPAGIWKELTENVNFMASNLTDQVRAIADVTTAVANGDLSHKITVDARGEFRQIKETVNAKIDHLNSFASEVSRVAQEVGVDGRLGGQAEVPGVEGIWRELTDNVNQLAANLTSQVRAIGEVATMVTRGDFTRSVTVDARGEVAELKDNVNKMIRNLHETTEKNAEQDWLKSNLTRLTRALQGQRDLKSMANIVLSELAPLVNAQHGLFYIMNESPAGENRLNMLSSYAHKERISVANEWKVGEGMVGQCAVEKRRILITDVPNDYIQITSGLGEAKPLTILVLPIMFENSVNAVIELASFARFSATQQALLEQVAESIGIVINTIEINLRTEELLQQSQTLTDELQSQQEELRETNQELEEKAQLLEEQKLEVEIKNREVEQAKTALEEKASQLELTSKYKSEFLSNMSHELRTPLNSLLILAEHLAENSKRHLDPKEVEFAKLIHVSGNDLLSLINEILDLSKIESGTVLVNSASILFTTVQDQIEKTFRHVAKERGVDIEITLASDLPPTIVTDEMRLLQVLKNLMSNSFKFTEKGQVSLRVARATSGWNSDNESLNKTTEVISFTVEDTGIGISNDKQRIIFEAFQQGDGRTARKYGGTGLGLSISREIARLLGGELVLVRSAPQQGSTFALYLPQNRTQRLVLDTPFESEQESRQKYQSTLVGSRNSSEASSYLQGSIVVDDRDLIEGDRVLLIIEDDPTFAKVILELAREKGFKGVVAISGAQAIDLARMYKPDAITLDIHIPDIDGWTILDTLKRDPDLRHIPVDVITVEDYPLRALSKGAFKYLTKPVSRVQLGSAIEATRTFLDRPMKNLLLVAGDKIEDTQITRQLGNGDINVHHARSGKVGLIEMGKKSFDCVVVATKLSDMSVADFITAMRKDELLEEIPVVVFRGASITDLERDELEKLGTASVVKSADSLDRLLDQTALFLHRVVSRLPEEKRKLLERLAGSSSNLEGRKVLIVDDDERNIIALTAALERRGVIVSSAESGALAIDLLVNKSGIDLVLMDIMMPEMDGYETMREIRKMPRFKKLPIIALTAKAMVGDREKCLEAGASDYLSKPVDVEQLASLMQVWLSN